MSSYMQLADGPAYLGDLYPDDVMEYMIAVPNQFGEMIWVREDQLDHLPDSVLYEIMQSQPNMSGMKDWFARRRERKDQRKSEKGAQRSSRKRRKEERHQGRQQSRASRIEIRGRREPGGFGRAFEGAAGMFQGAFGGGGEEDYYAGGERGIFDGNGPFPQITGGASIGVAKWWQNPLVIGGIVIGGGILAYALTRKKK